MTRKSSTDYIPWLIAGVVFLAFLVVLVWHFQPRATPALELASKASRVDLVGRMQLNLAAASEAEKSAVLAITDEESARFANQARAASAEVDRERKDLSTLLATHGSPKERDLLSQFSEVFGSLQQVDAEVLGLAVKNSNTKAFSLLFGPAADTLAEMDASLSRVIAKHAGLPDEKRVMALAFAARLGVLRIQAQLAPHIAEGADAKMDQMETTMAKDEAEIRKALEALAAFSAPNADADVTMSLARFGKYEEIKARIVPLSRANTNVRSLALSLNEKRKAMLLCLETLSLLKEAILEEPIVGVTTYGRPPRPR